jgi:hypothetical protein
MDVFIFQAALLCTDCGEAYKSGNFPPAIVADAILAGEEYSSDQWPAGPYSNGGGEADTPQHCDHCQVFLDNPLTGDGETYVRDAFREFVETGRGNPDVLGEWKSAYDWVWSDFEDITFAGMVEDGNVSDLMQRRFDDLASR